MKNTLEYKILKHLQENDNGEFIDIIGLIDDRKLLESKLRSLSREPEKFISARFPFFVVGGGLPNYTDDQLQAKIEFKGIQYLNEMENLNNNIINKGVLIQDSHLNNSLIKNQLNNYTNPTIKPSKWAIIVSFIEKIWWKILIPLSIGIVLVLVERGVIDIGL